MNIRTKHTRLVAAMAVLALVVAACGSDDDSSEASDTTAAAVETSPAATTADTAVADTAADTTETASTEPADTEPVSTEASGPDERPFKVMVIGEYSNELGLSLEESHAAIVGSLADLPNVEVLKCDSKLDPNEALNCMRQAVDEDVSAVITMFSNVTADGSILTEAGIPMLGNIDNSAPNAFGIISSEGGFAGMGVGVVEAGCTKVGTIHLEGTDNLVDKIDQGVELAGGEAVARAATPSNAPDVSAPIAKLLDAGADCIILSLQPQLIVQALTAIADSGQTPRVATVGAVFPKILRDAIPDLAEGVLISESVVNPDDPDAPVLTEINADIAAGNPDYDKADSFAVAAWVTAEVIKAAVANIDGDVTAASLQAALDELRDVDTQGASFPFSADLLDSTGFARFFNHYGKMYQIEGGEVVSLTDWYDIGPALAD